MSVFAVALPDNSGVSRDRAAAPSSMLAGTAACLGAALLLLVAPFEARSPLISLPGQSLSSVETVLMAVFAVWVGACVIERRWPEWKTPLTAPWVAFGFAALIAALASRQRTNALHMTGRFVLAFGVFLVAVNGVSTRARLKTVVAAAAVAGGVVATLVLLEYANVRPVLEWLRLFRANVAHIGAQVRAGGPFQYPTIASMYLEIVFALTLGLLLAAVDAGRHGLAAIAGVLLVAAAEATTLTFTRAGFVTMATSLGIVGILRFRERGMDRGVAVVAALFVLVALQFLTSRSIESLRLRMTTEGQDAWYRATIDAPAELSIPAGGTAIVAVRLTNTGYSSWDPAAANPIRFSYHWLMPDSDLVVSWEGDRTLFPDVVHAGDSVTVQARVVAPRQPGNYRLMWDVEQENRLWFSTEPDADLAFSRATVSGSAAGTIDASGLSVLPSRAVRPGRFVLWTAAARMFADHPWLGIGPDNFRLQYGAYARLPDADPRVHSNNMYLEVLAGGGVILAAGFLWLMFAIAATGRDLARQAGGHAFSQGSELASLAAGILAATAAIAVHGLVDSFLSFTSTYIAIAVTLGLLAGAERLTRGSAGVPGVASAGSRGWNATESRVHHAHRV